ncbi:MAG: hypothetical protein ACNS62_11970 [Candidatus Cyclobacteriaceae bacterium M3_2C_046]
MRYYIFLLFILFGPDLQAQISRNTFNKVVDLYNCNLVEYSISHADLDSIPDCHCENMPDFQQIKACIPSSLSKTLALSQEIERIKTIEYHDSFNINSLKQLLLEDIFQQEETYNLLYVFNQDKLEDDVFQDFKAELAAQIDGYLRSSQMASQNNRQTEDIEVLRNEVFKLEQNLEKAKNNIRWLFIITLFLLVLLLGAAIYYFFKHIKRSNPPMYVKKYINRKIGEKDSQWYNPAEMMEQFKSQIDQQIQAINEKLVQLKIEKKAVPAEPAGAINQPGLFYDELPGKKKSDDKVFYMPTPNEDGSFNANARQDQFIEGKSIYKFIKTSDTSAEFQIENKTSSVQLALQYSNVRIQPCCEPMNAFNLKAHAIITAEKGLVELEMDKWVLKRKARIRYEY